MEALQAIQEAISRGVPLFNGGDAQGCYEAYREVSMRLLKRPQQSLPSSGAQRLQQALQASSAGPAQDRAWTMRHALDDVIAMVRSGGGDDGNGDGHRVSSCERRW